MVRRCVQFLLSGTFFVETVERDVDHRDPRRIVPPPRALAFRFYDVVEEGGERRRADVSKTFYIGGKVMTADEVALLPGDYADLLADMRVKGWRFVVRTRQGDFRPFDPERDLCVPEPAHHDAEPPARR